MHTTKQRKQVLDILEKNKDSQLSVDEVMLKLSKSDVKIGIATVYRTLDYFEQTGIIRKYISNDNTKACYQFIGEHSECNNHFHLKCLNCGKVIHLNCESIDSVVSHIENDHGFSIDRTKTLLYGTCNDCSISEHNTKDNK